MPRGLVVVLLVGAACGRIRFDATSDAGTTDVATLCTPLPVAVNIGTTSLELCAGVTQLSLEATPGTQMFAYLAIEPANLRLASLVLVAPDGVPFAPTVWDSMRLRASGMVTTGGAQIIEVVADVAMTAMLTVEAQPPLAEVFYIAVNGSDSNDGSLGAPWQDWNFALDQLHEGDVLIAEDGLWNVAQADVDCTTTGTSGTLSAPVTLIARHQRRAHLRGDGMGHTLWLRNCAYWIIDGLQLSNVDDATNGIGTSLLIGASTNILAKNLLVHHPNRCGNNSALEVYFAGTANVVVEDSEIYDFHLNALLGADGPGLVFRRNYVHSRNAAGVPCTTTDTYAGRGDTGVHCYNFMAAPSCIVENMLVENVASGALSTDAAGFDVYGTLIRDAYFGVLHGSAFTPAPGPTGGIANHVVCVGCDVGVWNRGLNLEAVNVTAIAGRGRESLAYGIGFAADPAGGPGGTTRFRSVLALDNENYGFSVNGQQTLLITHSNAFASPQLYQAGVEEIADMSGNIQQSLSVAPSLVGDVDGACLAYIPDGSNMKGAGENGADIGASVINRYEGGGVTSKKLWNQRTGAFPCGAVIAGVNDVPGASCFDAHERFRIGVGGCPIP